MWLQKQKSVQIISVFTYFLQEGENFPVIHLHLTKSSDDFIQYTGELKYEELMDFITSHTK